MDCRFREGHLKRVVALHIAKPLIGGTFTVPDNITGIITCVRRDLTSDIISGGDLDDLRRSADRPNDDII